MAIIIRDKALEKKIDRERRGRGDSTMSKTASNLVREYLTRLEVEREHERRQPLSESA